MEFEIIVFSQCFDNSNIFLFQLLILCNNTTLFWRVAAADLGIVLSQQNQIKRLRGAAELPSMQAANIKRE